MRQYFQLPSLFLACLLYLCGSAIASNTGRDGFNALKNCVMKNDTSVCHKILTPASHAWFDRFMSYKLMPCLPTNFSYHSEKASHRWIVVKATMPAENNNTHTIKLAFTKSNDSIKLDVPESLRMGLGENWETTIRMTEQVFLMIRANAGGNLNCDQVNNIMKP